MLTKESYKAVLAKPVKHSAKALINHLEKYGLTPSVDIKSIKAEYKSVLFSKLLEVDPGLKLRHDMLRTTEAQQKLKEETINLQGYTELDEAEHLIMLYKRDYNGAYGVGPDLPLQAHGISENMFLITYGGSVQAALEEHVIDMEDDETFQKLKLVEKAINVLIKDGLVRADQNLYADLQHLIRVQHGEGKVSVDEGYAYHTIHVKPKMRIGR